jgi:hypothetical protein
MANPGSNIVSTLEAERHGLLPDDKQALLDAEAGYQVRDWS